MAKLINEAKRMQFLAGLITESQLEETEQTNELFGFGAPTLKPGDTIEIIYDKPLAKKEGGNDDYKFTAKFTGNNSMFEITNYKYSADSFDRRFMVGNKTMEKSPSEVAVTQFGNNPLVWEGKKVTINAPEESGKITVGQKLSIGGSGYGPKITSMKLNGKEVKKVNVPK